MNSQITSLGFRAILSTSALALTMGLTTAAHAQVTTSSMRGEIVASSGAPVPNANVIITHEPTGTVSTVSTNTSGVFTSRGLRVGGPYTVTIGGSDIQGTTVEDIYLSVETVTLQMRLSKTPLLRLMYNQAVLRSFQLLVRITASTHLQLTVWPLTTVLV